MGITERKEKQKLEIKKLILDASIKLFTEKGFENVSIRKIAEIIEYSPTTVYLYFKDKNEIMFELHELGFRKMNEYQADLVNYKNPLVRLHKMGENYIRFGMENPDFYDVMFLQKAPMEALRNIHDNCEWLSGDKAMGALQETIKECMDKKLIMEGDVNVVSMSIWAMVHGLVTLAIRHRLEKLVEEEHVIPMMHQSLTWLLNTIDRMNQ